MSRRLHHTSPPASPPDLLAQKQGLVGPALPFLRGTPGHEHVAVATRPFAAVGAWLDPPTLLEALQPAIHPWLLESSRVDDRLGRVSLLGIDPYAVLTAFGERLELEVHRSARVGWPLGRAAFETDPFEAVDALWPRGPEALCDLHPRLPFVGGAVAVFGYELAERIERLDLAGRDDLQTPDLVLLLVDRLISIDHERGEATLVTLGFGADAESATRASEVALAEWSRVLDAAMTPPADADADARAVRSRQGVRSVRTVSVLDRDKLDAEDELEAEKQDAVDPGPGADEYARWVRCVLAEIERGNVYEVNLTRRMSVPFVGSTLSLYRALRAENPAPFAAYLELPGVTVVGSSPERFLKLTPDGHVESRPIKGTRPRGATPDRDAALAEALVTSPKDRAENLMIVDLVRNDLGRVCEVGSVRVPELMQVEAYATVFQLVSTVVGRLRRDRRGIDLVRACFPPGSMTGAPKIAAMRTAARLEPVRRGIYSGALGYLDARGGLDLSVVIRSLLVKAGRAHLHVGGAVVADSDPAAEYEETLDKARALRAALDRLAQIARMQEEQEETGSMGRRE